MLNEEISLLVPHELYIMYISRFQLVYDTNTYWFESTGIRHSPIQRRSSGLSIPSRRNDFQIMFM